MDSCLVKYSLYIFDLDDTLYNESDFLKVAYDHLAISISVIVKKPSLRKEISFFLFDSFKLSGRKDLFQKLIDRFALSLSPEDCLHTFRQFAIDYLTLYDWVQEVFLSILRSGSKIAICTNGNVKQQQMKVKALGLDSEEIHILYADRIKRKPAPDPIFSILKYFSVPAKQALFIGDLNTDMESAYTAGTSFILKDDFIKKFNCYRK